MMRSLFSGVSGLKNHQTAMDVIGNNVANVNTTAYKANRVIFQDIVNQTISEATAPNGTTSGGVNSKQVGLGMSIAGISKDMTEGSAESTESPLDFSIQGEGYFIVENKDGSLSYTRSGSFKPDADGYLVTQNGQYVMGVVSADATGTNLVNGTALTAASLSKIKLSGTVDASHVYTDYAIDSYGKITATNTANSNAVETIGRLALSTFNNPAGLDAVGNSNYDVSSNSGSASYQFVSDNCGGIQSGQLEMSNVSLATELTNMIIVQRGFQANSRVITTSDSMLEELVNLKR